MQIVVNGDTRQVPEGLTIARLLEELQIESKQVAVEVNLELVPRGQHARHALSPGDRLEVVTLVGGG